MLIPWVQSGIGVILIIAPWMFGAGRSLIGWADVILGVVLVLLNVWTIFGKEPINKDGELRT